MFINQWSYVKSLRLDYQQMTRQLILMKSISILKYTSTYLQQVDKQDCLLNQSSKSDHLPSQGGLRDEHLPIK